ncbi:MAG: glycosyltransferase [Candidatus Gottesmanbacteria bacterium]
MKVALVHDYLKEYGGAERVLEALTEIYPEAPIYTAFCDKDSTAGRAFSQKKIITSGFDQILQWKNLFSPLRFLTPIIWESFDFSSFDLVISSASWYITKSIITKPPTVHICYCHTPPRWLYGYQTAREWKKFLPIRIYGEILAHWLRQYDYTAAQRPARNATHGVAGGVDYFIANSINTQERIKKFYRRDSTVIYPPVYLSKAGKMLKSPVSNFFGTKPVRSRPDSVGTPFVPQKLNGLPASYFLVVSRLAAAKNIDLTIKACNELKEELWIVGSGSQEKYLRSISGPTIKFLGQVSDSELSEIYKNCKALICTAIDEDFGITPVEAQAAGRPVIAFRGGGYLETVIENKTGVFYNEQTVESLIEAIEKLSPSAGGLDIKEDDCRQQAEKFGKDEFKNNMLKFIEEKITKNSKEFSV